MSWQGAQRSFCDFTGFVIHWSQSGIQVSYTLWDACANYWFRIHQRFFGASFESAHASHHCCKGNHNCTHRNTGSCLMPESDHWSINYLHGQAVALQVSSSPTWRWWGLSLRLSACKAGAISLSYGYLMPSTSPMQLQYMQLQYTSQNKHKEKCWGELLLHNVKPELRL